MNIPVSSKYKFYNMTPNEFKIYNMTIGWMQEIQALYEQWCIFIHTNPVNARIQYGCNANVAHVTLASINYITCNPI